MKEKKLHIGSSDIVLVVISALFLTGILTLFAPCGPKDDGSWMSCHWAGNAVAGIAAILLLVSVIHLFIPNEKVKAGLSIAMIPTALLSLLLPGSIIALCMMDTMRCRAVMRPGAIVMSILVIAAAVFDAAVQFKKK